MLIILITLILIISFVLALRSMRDFELPEDIKKLLKFKPVRGTIVFLKDKIKHYHA